MTVVYIGTPSDYLYDLALWEKYPFSDSACDIIKTVTSAKSVKFVCNSLGGIYDGDVYKVTLTENDSELLFLLRTGFVKIDNKIVTQYIKQDNQKTLVAQWSQSPC